VRVLLVHPSALMYSEIFLRLEPLGLERVAAALPGDAVTMLLETVPLYLLFELGVLLASVADRRARVRAGSVNLSSAQ